MLHENGVGTMQPAYCFFPKPWYNECAKQILIMQSTVCPSVLFWGSVFLPPISSSELSSIKMKLHSDDDNLVYPFCI